MVTKWGLSEKLGPLSYSEDEGEVFLGRSVTQTKNVSDDTAHEIDDEVRQIIDVNYDRAEKILKEKVSILHAMTAALMKYETIDQVQIEALMKGEVPPPPEDWEDDDSSSSSADGDDSGSAVVADVSGDGSDSSDNKGDDAVADPAS